MNASARRLLAALAVANALAFSTFWLTGSEIDDESTVPVQTNIESTRSTLSVADVQRVIRGPDPDAARLFSRTPPEAPNNVVEISKIDEAANAPIRLAGIILEGERQAERIAVLEYGDPPATRRFREGEVVKELGWRVATVSDGYVVVKRGPEVRRLPLH